MKKIILIVFVIVALCSGAYGKCSQIDKNKFYLSSDLVFKGKVIKVQEEMAGLDKNVQLHIEVIKIFKGTLKEKDVTYKYRWSNAKEPFRTYLMGNEYVFTGKIENKKLFLDTHSCMPILTEKEIEGLKQSK